MSVDSRISTALSTFGEDVDNGVSLSRGKSYFTFNYSVIPDDFGDDAPEHERYLVQVHYFCPLSVNITAKKTTVRRALYAAGFTWATIADASDGNGRHIIFECEDAEGVDVHGDA